MKEADDTPDDDAAQRGPTTDERPEDLDTLGHDEDDARSTSPNVPASSLAEASSRMTNGDLEWVAGGSARGPAVGADMSGVPEKSDWLRGRGPWSRTDVLIALAIGLVFVGIALVFRTAIVPTDPINYVRSAREFPSDYWVPLGYTRYGMILPLLPLVGIFGNAEIAYYFWPIVSTGGLAASVYLLAVHFWTRRVATLAVALAMASPIVFINFSRGYPDVQSAATSAIALVVGLAARDRLRASNSRATVLLVATGLLLGWSFEAKETTVFLWPLIIVMLLGRAHPVRRLALVVAGMAVWAVADMLIGAFGYGDALLRVHAFTRQDLSQATIPGDVAALGELVGRRRSFYLAYIPRALLETAGGAWVVVAGAVGLLGLFSRRGGARFVALILMLSYGGFVAIAGALSPAHPSGRIDIERYWVSFLPFVGLAAAGVGADLVRSLSRKRPGAWLTRRWARLLMSIVVLALPLIPLIAHVSTYPTYVVNGADQLSQVRTHLTGTSGTVTIYTDYRTQRMLPIYERGPFGGPKLWSGQFLNIDRKDSKPSPGDLILINSESSDACGPCRVAVGAWLKESGPLPPEWVEVWTTPSRNLVMYRVERKI